jgi:phage-related minor tail protein
MGDLDSHLEELLARKKKFRQGDIENEEAERLNTTSIVQFHEKLTKFLKSCNIKISNKEEKQQLYLNLENVLNSIISVQT